MFRVKRHFGSGWLRLGEFRLKPILGPIYLLCKNKQLYRRFPGEVWLNLGRFGFQAQFRVSLFRISSWVWAGVVSFGFWVRFAMSSNDMHPPLQICTSIIHELLCKAFVHNIK